MQPQDINTSLTRTSAALATRAPDEWRAFVEAFVEFAEHHKHNLLQSPLPELQVNQGRAQILATVARNLKECIANADKLKGTK